MKLTDENRLSLVFPKLSKEWHFGKNKKLTPRDVSYGSHKKAWWLCQKCKYEWEATINGRSNRNSKCPCCDGKVASKNNCLAKINNTLAKEWHSTKNRNLTPYDITPNSSKRAWWKCKKCQNEWSAIVASRNRGAGCPYCSGHRISSSNRLDKNYPKLIKEWNFDKNKKKPFEYSYGSKKTVWWTCKECGHEWIAMIKTRTGLKSGCPHCKGVILKNGVHCDSIVEAFFYLKYKKNKLKFKCNNNYPKKNNKKLGVYGNCRYDFYFPEKNKYIEVTSYSRNEKWWFSYLRNIVRKRRYVRNVLESKFEFIQTKLTKLQINLVKRNSKNYV